MKVLCLHGRGTSGAIFKSQTSSIRSRLSDLNLEFDFLDGPYPCPPAPGIDLFYPPPYYSYYEELPPNGTSTGSSYTVESLKKTHAWLSSILSERGPYDLVLTFSQGTALAASMLLLHELQEAQAQAGYRDRERDAIPAPSSPPFKSAIFICGGAPLPLLEHIGFHIPPSTKARDLASRSALASMADSAAILSLGSARWRGLEDIDVNHDHPHSHSHSHSHSESLPSGFTFNKEDEIRREISGSPLRISIPTVHIYGERDPRYVAGIQLSEVCVRERRKVYNHGGGHEIPRFEAVTAAMADLVRWAVRAAAAAGAGGSS